MNLVDFLVFVVQNPEDDRFMSAGQRSQVSSSDCSYSVVTASNWFYIKSYLLSLHKSQSELNNTSSCVKEFVLPRVIPAHSPVHTNTPEKHNSAQCPDSSPHTRDSCTEQSRVTGLRHWSSADTGAFLSGSTASAAQGNRKKCVWVRPGVTQRNKVRRIS